MCLPEPGEHVPVSSWATRQTAWMSAHGAGRPQAGGWLHSPPSLWQFALNLFLSYLICTFLPAQLTSVSLKCPSFLHPCLQPSRRTAPSPSALVLSGPHQDPAPSCLSLGAQEKAEPSTGCCRSSKQGGGELQRRPPEKRTRRPSPLALPSRVRSTPSWSWLAGTLGLPPGVSV